MARLDSLLAFIKRAGGSDLHLSAGLPPRIRLRGALEDIPETAVLTEESLRQLLHEVAEPRLWETFLHEHDADFAYGLGGVGRFRANYFEHENGPGAVFRLIPEVIRPLAELGLPPGLEAFAHLAAGLVLVTGPTGAGKSTTLAGIIDEINRTYAKHIVTIEDPIEFAHTPKTSTISQREIGRHSKTFAAALTAALREDPDVILVGELRDAETISLALLAAEMGALVFSTLHTNSAAKTIDRLIDVFPADEQGHIRLMLSEALAGVVAQQLVATADGLSQCAAIEVLIRTSALPTLIRDNNIPMITTLIQSNRALGMQTMDDALEVLVRDGRVRPEDAQRKAIDKARFERLVVAARETSAPPPMPIDADP